MSNTPKVYKLTGINREQGHLLETNEVKIFRSETYNYNFNKITGYFQRWGKTKEEDPTFSPFGPEILDIEISTICHGPSKIREVKDPVNGNVVSQKEVSLGPCSHCYKSLSPKGTNMSLDTFKQLMSKMTPFVNQVAFGIGDIASNPDLFPIMEYTRSLGVIPNITLNGAGMTDELYKKLANTCGAISISNYNKDTCYGTVQKLNEFKKKPGATLQQVNIHQLLSETTLDQCWEIMKDTKTDPRLVELGSIVFLLLKPKGKRNTLVQLKSLDKFKQLVDYALDNNISLGFDSCGCGNLLEATKDRKEYKQLQLVAEPCESSIFSFYASVDAEFYPCSFSEEIDEWKTGISILDKKNILDIWKDPRISQFRNKLMCKNRNCPLYDLEMK